MTVTPVRPLVPRRVCRQCGVMYDDPRPRTAPAGYCSAACHKLSKPAPVPAKRNGTVRTGGTPAKRRAISPAAPEQRAAIKDRACLVCRNHQGACHPAHLIDRSLTTEGADDPRAVVPLCPEHHRAFDELGLDLLPFLEPHYRDELAFAVRRVGLVATLRRVTNDRAACGIMT